MVDGIIKEYFMQQNLYDQLCDWDSSGEYDRSNRPTLSQVLSLYTGMYDIDGIIDYIKIHHNKWEKIAKRNDLTFDDLICIFTDTMIYRDDPKIEFQILRYCGDDGTLTTLIEIDNCKVLNRNNNSSQIYKRRTVGIELDWHIGSLAT